MTTRMPVMFVFHGGGPCFFMDWDPPHAWDALRADLEALTRIPSVSLEAFDQAQVEVCLAYLFSFGGKGRETPK